MLFFYIRHGDPIYTPDSLTPLGKRQAEALAKRLALYGIDKIYSSTSERAVMTATPTAELLHKEIIQLDFANEKYAWQEYTLKCEDGKSRWIFQHPQAIELLNSKDVRGLGYHWHEHPFFKDCAPRRIASEADKFLSYLGYFHEGFGRYRVTEERDERVALFAHQGFGLAFLSHLLGIPYPYFASHFDLGHSSMTVIEFKGDEHGIAYPRVLTMSNDSHLFREGLPTKYQNSIYF